jgi:hypothetical protein
MNAYRFVAALMLAVALAGCGRKKPTTTAATPVPLPEGKSRYSYIFDPGNPALGLPEDVQFRRPLKKQDVATYPANALAADGPHREVVSSSDTHGNVDRIVVPDGVIGWRSFRCGPRRAVEEALLAIRAGCVSHVARRGQGRRRKPDCKIATSSDLVPVYYDVGSPSRSWTARRRETVP